jgi:hypothetical protein
LILSGTPKEDVYIYKEDEQYYLLTRDNTLLTTHKLFDKDETDFETYQHHCDKIAGAPTELQLRTLAQIFIFAFVLEDDDVHACNVGLDEFFSRFHNIDKDRLRFLIAKGLQSARSIVASSSAPGCFDINEDLINAYLTDKPPLPHYHPLKCSEFFFKSEVNKYPPGITAFYNAVYSSIGFKPMFIEELLEAMYTTEESIEETLDLFIDPEDALYTDFKQYYFSRISQLRTACTTAEKFQSQLLQSNLITKLYAKVASDEQKKTIFVNVTQNARYEIIQSLIRYYLNKVIDIVKETESIPAPLDNITKMLQALRKALGTSHHDSATLLDLCHQAEQFAQKADVKNLSSEIPFALKLLNTELQSFLEDCTYEDTHRLGKVPTENERYLTERADYDPELLCLEYPGKPCSDHLAMSFFQLPARMQKEESQNLLMPEMSGELEFDEGITPKPRPLVEEAHASKPHKTRDEDSPPKIREIPPPAMTEDQDWVNIQAPTDMPQPLTLGVSTLPLVSMFRRGASYLFSSEPNRSASEPSITPSLIHH